MKEQVLNAAALPKGTVYPAVKRMLDVALSAIGLTLLSPLFLAVAVAVKAEDGGPVFYRHTRLGKNGAAIRIYKFRTMRDHADRLEEVLTPEQLAEYYKEFKLNPDPRITKVWDFLRRSSIDELPQLVNVLRGQMSLIGPRPLVQDEAAEKYSQIQRHQLLSVRPGLTGLWQVSGRSNCTYESGERQKLELYYAQNVSPEMDVQILLRTAGVVWKGTGAR